MKEYEVTLTLTREMLGATPKDPNVYETYVAGKAALTDEQLAQEIQTAQDIERKGWTGFHATEDGPFLLNYILKGFFKEACSMLRRVPKTASNKLRAHKKVIDGLVFIEPLKIKLQLPPGQQLGVNERPLRAQTAQGERVTLARSDTCPAGTTITFTVQILGVVTETLLNEWLDYGKLRGLRQWRNAGYGTFTYEMTKL